MFRPTSNIDSLNLYPKKMVPKRSRLFPRRETKSRQNIWAVLVFLSILLLPPPHSGESQLGTSISPKRVFLHVSSVDPRRAYKIREYSEPATLSKLPVDWQVEPLRLHTRQVQATARLLRRYLRKTSPYNYTGMEKDITNELTFFRQKHLLIPGDDVTVRIIDLHAGRLLVSIKSDTKRMAASLIKPFVMMAVYDRIAEGKIKKSRRVERLLRRMIIVSNNWATNKLVEILGNGDISVGLRQVNRIIWKYRFLGTKMVEKIPGGGRTYRNYVTGRDLSRFFYLLYHKKLISPFYSEQMMKKLLAVRTSRVRTFVVRNDGTPVADKTGFVCGLNGDAGVVFQSKTIRNGHDYVFVFMVENHDKPHTRSWRHNKTRVIQRISNKVYLSFKCMANTHTKYPIASLNRSYMK